MTNLSLLTPPVNRLLHAVRVPRDDEIREQRQRPRDRDHFVAAPTAFRRDSARVDRALQLMD